MPDLSQLLLKLFLLADRASLFFLDTSLMFSLYSTARLYSYRSTPVAFLKSLEMQYLMFCDFDYLISSISSSSLRGYRREFMLETGSHDFL